MSTRADCRWLEASGPRGMTFELVGRAPALHDGCHVVEVSWANGRAEELRHLRVHARHGSAALERCVLALSHVVGRLQTLWR